MSEFHEGRRGGDDGFDLPRYATRDDPSMHSGTHYLYSSAASSPQAATYDPSSFATNPATTTTTTTTNQGRQPARLSQILDPDHTSGSNMARSASLNHASRTRHLHQPQTAEDRERTFSGENQPNNSNQRHLAGSFYPAALGFGSEPAIVPTQQSHQDYLSYVTDNSLRRSNTQYDPSTTSRTTFSPPRPAATTAQRAPPAPMDSTGNYQQSHSNSNINASYSNTYGTGYSGNNDASQAPPNLSMKPPSSPMSIGYGSPSASASQHSQSQHSYHVDTQHYQSPSNPSAMSSSTPLSSDLKPYFPPQQTHSSPNTPLSHNGPRQHQLYPGQDLNQSMKIEQPPPPPRRIGFKRVRDARDLRPAVNQHPAGRRVDASGVIVSPIKALTTHISQTYNLCNPQFRYEMAHNPRRVLTKPSKPAHNEGYDNEDYDYILYVNDWLGPEEGQNRYLILDILGQGTFGQVVKCQNMKTHEIVAVKVVKNKPAYFSQSMMEVTILELLNGTWDPHDEHHILRLRDTFIHKKHLCLVFELLSSNLYELIKQNQFSGLSTQLVRVFTAQLLDALTVLNEARLIHCDLKPENILLKTLQAPQIKVIDFGSACHERQTVYTYIQSRFYRSPEVLLGMPYTSAIDMWSLGCIAVELFLGLPLFPGTSEYNQITRIVEMLGLPPTYALEMGKQSSQFFSSYIDEFGRKQYRLKSLDQYSREHGTQEQPGKKYFAHNTLPEIVRAAPMPRASNKPGDLEKEMANRTAFIDFVQGLLNLNPIERWSPQQAKLHPFITGEKFTGPFVPSGSKTGRSNSTGGPAAVDPKRPYGGLVPTQPKGNRAYTDAASYNQQLAQHQAYTAQAATQQAANNAMRNPYAQPTSYPREENPIDYSPQAASASQQPRLQHQASTGTLPTSHSYPNAPGNALRTLPAANNPNPPSVSYYPASRNRANTINQMDIVPPQIARIANMGVEASIGRNTLTPVLNREDAIREWERRQSGKASTTHTTYPQLEYLQQQAELPSWSSSSNTRGYGIAPPPPAANTHYQSVPTSVMMDSSTSGLRDVTMSATNPRLAGTRYDQQLQTALPSPPQAYSGSSAGGQRYAQTYQQSSTRPHESFDHYSPSQSQQFQSYGVGSNGQQPGQSQQQRFTAANPTSPQANSHSFYPASTVPSGTVAARNPFSSNSPSIGTPTQTNARRVNEMDIWPR